MFGDQFTPEVLLVKAGVIAVMLLVAFPIHEFSHALAAFRLGDDTARLMGRLTLDPRAHLDPAGAMLMVVSILIGFGIGWAKPTPYNPMNLRGGRWGEAIISAAGPFSNLVLAIAAAIPLRYIYATGMDAGPLSVMLFFNLLPIPPLDGSKVLFAFLDPRTAYQVRPVLEQYGIVILFAAMLLPIFGGNTLIGVVFTEVLEPIERILIGL